MSEKIHLPTGVEIDLVVYATSDKLGVDAVVRLNGCGVLPKIEDLIGEVLFSNLHIPLKAEGEWRVMTADEVTKYKAQEERDRRVDAGLDDEDDEDDV